MRTALLAGLLLLVLAAAPAAAQEERPLADRTPQDGTYLAGYAGWQVWSETTGDGTRYSLYARSGGVTKRLPAPSALIAHDPGAGKGPTGRPAAVYQRCVRAACTLWTVDLASGRQQQLKGLGKVTRGSAFASGVGELADETHPRIWGARVAFQTGRGAKAVLRVAPSTGGGGGRTITTPADRNDLEALALGPKQLVGIFAKRGCSGSCGATVSIYGLDSGARRRLDEDERAGDCYVDFRNLSFRTGAFRWAKTFEAADSSNTECEGKIESVAYTPTTGRLTRR